MYYRQTKLREVLAAQERDQAWLARKVGCSESLISRMLSGERRIPVWFAERASVVLGVPIDLLFGELVFTGANDSSADERSVA